MPWLIEEVLQSTDPPLAHAPVKEALPRFPRAGVQEASAPPPSYRAK